MLHIPQTASHDVTSVSIQKLQPYKRNARKHSDRQIQQIAASISSFGFITPIIIDKDNTILSGHGRVAAAKKLGMDRVPAILVGHLSEVDRRAFILAENRLAELSGWDKEILAIELESLTALDFNVELTGFSTAEIDLTLDPAPQKKDDPADSIPEPLPGPTVTRRGDVWELGEHRLLCGDATDPADYRLLMNKQKAQMIFTDPPYNVPISGHVCGLGKVQHREFAMAVGEMTPEQFTDFLSQVMAQLCRYSQNGSIHYLCMDWRHLAELLEAGRDNYTEYKQLIVWSKDNAGMGAFYRSKHELVAVFKHGNEKHINNFGLGEHGRYRTNVWEYPGVNSLKGNRRQDLELHPTVKPVSLVADAIRDCSKRGGIILDPFMGSGTTLIAAQKAGRIAYGMELDPGYVDVAIRRWEALTGNTARNVRTGLSFAEMVANQPQEV